MGRKGFTGPGPFGSDLGAWSAGSQAGAGVGRALSFPP